MKKVEKKENQGVMRSGLVPNLTTRWLCLTLVVKGSSVCEVLA